MPLFGAKSKTRVQIDSKALASLRKLNLSAQNCSLSVGVHDDAGTYEDAPESGGKPVSVAQVALWSEYGTSRSPARPFFYPTLKDREQAIASLQAKCMAAIYAKKMTLMQALSKIGFLVQVAFQNAIKSNIGPALSEGYLARRQQQYPGAGSRTLIRSGLLLRSIRFRVTVDGKTLESGPGEAPPVEVSAAAREQARKDAVADLQRRATQRRAAKAAKGVTQKAFESQQRVRPASHEPKKVR